MTEPNHLYAPTLSSSIASKMLRCRVIQYGRYTWPSYSRWIVPGTDSDDG